MSSQIDEPANLRLTNSASIDWSRLKPRCFDHGCTGKARGFEHDPEKSAAFPIGFCSKSETLERQPLSSERVAHRLPRRIGLARITSSAPDERREV
jgi:hypothetical protein